MALEQTTELYEILVRLEGGVVTGAHAIDRKIVRNDGVVISDHIGEPRPITSAEVGTIIGAENATMIEAYNALTVERNAAVEAKANAEAAQATAEAALAAKQSEMDAAVEAKQAEIDALNAQLNPVDEQGFAVLSPVQIRLGLLAAGITSAHIDEAISAIADDKERESATYYWEYSREYHHDHALIGQFSSALGLTSEQVDAMWGAAAQL